MWPFSVIMPSSQHRFGVLTEHSNMASSSAEVGSLAVAGPSREEGVSLTQIWIESVLNQTHTNTTRSLRTHFIFSTCAFREHGIILIKLIIFSSLGWIICKGKTTCSRKRVGQSTRGCPCKSASRLCSSACKCGTPCKALSEQGKIRLFNNYKSLKWSYETWITITAL